MNVESANANVSPLLPTNSGAEGVSLPLAEGGATPKGFSESLLAQIGLLMGAKGGGQVPLQTQALADLQNTNPQDVAGSVGKDLPVTDAANGANNLSATLGAVTDTLKYIAAGNAAGKKAAETGQNVQNVITLPAETGQNAQHVIASPAKKTGQNARNVIIETEQNIKDTAAIINAPVQKDAGLTNSDFDKGAKNKSRDQMPPAGDSNVQGEPAAAIILPPVVLTEQEKINNNVAQADGVKENIVASFVNPLTKGATLNLSRKDGVEGNAAQQGVGFYQPVQDKQDFNLKYFETAGQAEKSGQIGPQSLSLEGDKISPRVAGDVAQLNNRPVLDNKADVPTLAKPLSHPEWSKDLGDRIVWMSNKAIPTAEIKMNPQHLGPISVRIDVNQDHQANIVFTAQHAVVREALEASIPKLREMMSAQQLSLGDVNISQNSTSGQGQPQSQSFAQMADSGRRGKGTEDMLADRTSDAMEDVENGQAVVSKGLLSIYA